MKYFPLLLHFILFCVAGGAVIGLHAENANLILTYSVEGLAVGLGLSAVIRLMLLA